MTVLLYDKKYQPIFLTAYFILAFKNTIFIILIFTGKEVEQFTWSTFLHPFHWIVWLCLICFTILFSFTLWLFHSYQNDNTVISITEGFCIASSSIFGMVIWNANEFNSNDSGRMTLLNVLLIGSVFFYIYSGFLTSSLAIPNENFPFNSPEELIGTNYR